MPKRLTKEEIQARINDSDTVHLEILGEYVNAKTKINFKCKTCNTKGSIRLDGITRAIQAETHCCSQCNSISRKKGVTTKTLQTQIDNSNTVNLRLVSEYINTKNTVDTECTICGNRAKKYPKSIMESIKLHTSGCAICTKNRLTKTHEEYVLNLTDRSITVLGKYIGNKKHILHSCNICNTCWNARPDNILSGRGCPCCAQVTKQIGYKGSRGLELKDKAIKIPCSIYILDSDACIKVGVSISVLNRVKDLKYQGFECKLLKQYNINSWHANIIESRIHTDFKSFHVLHKFDGCTELHYKEDLQGISTFIEQQIKLNKQIQR